MNATRFGALLCAAGLLGCPERSPSETPPSFQVRAPERVAAADAPSAASRPADRPAADLPPAGTPTVATRTSSGPDLLPVEAATPLDLPRSAPSWAKAGSRAEAGQLFGVGVAKGIRNKNLARATADNRARAEIARQLKATKDIGSGAVRLSEVRIVERRLDPKTGTAYALAVLELHR